jgi:hypothetical protein
LSASVLAFGSGDTAADDPRAFDSSVTFANAAEALNATTITDSPNSLIAFMIASLEVWGLQRPCHRTEEGAAFGSCGKPVGGRAVAVTAG